MKTKWPEVKVRQVDWKSKRVENDKMYVKITEKKVPLLELANEEDSKTTIAYCLTDNVPTVIITITNPMLDFTSGEIKEN